MKHTLFPLCFVLFVGIIHAQDPAPDFMITDSDDQDHMLYATHLDQGQAVLVDIFFTTCPPCASIAPFLEPFYQEWGGGDDVVEFISLSDKAFDNNSDVAAYKDNYGHTFPSAGNDGGSLDAIVPYTDGTYGLFLGTPTFVVIAPDGTVTYNPFGPGIQGRINAIDQALRATGIEKPAIPHHISGTIMRSDSSGIADVDLIFPEADTLPEASNDDGLFDLSAHLVARDNYILKGQKNDDYREGVSIRDLVKIQQHIMNVHPLDTPEQVLAADANRSGSVTTQDVIALLKLILHVDNELSNQDSWIFIDANYEFPDPANPFPDVYDTEAALIHFVANLTSDPVFQILGIKIGDVD